MSDRQPDLEKRTEAFFSAITLGDWQAAADQIHPEAVAIQNIVGKETDARELLQSMRGMVESLDSLRYENVRRVVGNDAVVEQHDVCMTRKDGLEVRLDVCIILGFDPAGIIIRIDEYLDSAAAARLLVGGDSNRA
ncbi:MAG: nuclear transport factor 2 family protein [Myxococcota bacterium]|jgi:ketosteroid isomerase-like protein|nr:nuclear transport factor 2 family protein [Myxococcota bacterium]